MIPRYGCLLHLSVLPMALAGQSGSTHRFPQSTIGFNTSLSTAVSFTFIGFAYGTGWTIGFNTSFSAAASFTFIGFAYGTGWTIGFNTSTLFTPLISTQYSCDILIVYII